MQYLVLYLGDRTCREELLGGFVEGIGLPPERARVIEVRQGERIPDPRDYCGIVITGASPMVTEHLEWSERTAQRLPDAVEAGVPILGVCYGHQLLAYALGGEVARNPNGCEVGTVEIELLGTAAEDPLFTGETSPLPVQASHLESVIALPPRALRLARNVHDANHAFRIGTHAWGLQFHPEFSAGFLTRLVERRRDRYVSEGLDPDAIVAGLRPTPAGARLLRRFGRVMSVYADR